MNQERQLSGKFLFPAKELPIVRAERYQAYKEAPCQIYVRVPSGKLVDIYSLRVVISLICSAGFFRSGSIL